MTDRYAHLRPARDRGCRRQDGVPKKPYTRKQAYAAACLKPDYEHYRCATCGHWHVGRRSKRQRQRNIRGADRVDERNREDR